MFKKNSNYQKESLIKSDYDFVSIINKGNSPYVNSFLLNTPNIYFADLKVILELKSKKKEYCENVFSMDTEYEFGKRISEFENIANSTFSMTRFSKDLQFDQKLVKKMYLKWIEKAFLQKNHYILYTLNENRISSFIVLYNEGDILNIELLATNPDFLRQGLASMLISKALLLAEELKLEHIHVATQADNVRAMNFYVEKGFRILTVDSLFHYHKVLS